MQQTLKILQISDPHLSADGQTLQQGLNTDQTLQWVLEQSLLNFQPDLIVVTGDISQHGFENSYLRMKSYLDKLGLAHVWLPGNHDDRSLMEKVAPAQMQRSYTVGDWLLLCIDSHVPGKVGGEIADTELEAVRRALSAARGRPVLAFTHHHPVTIGCKWLDGQQIANGAELIHLLAEYPFAKALSFGHIHQQFEAQYETLRLLGNPSTWAQFKPGQDDFCLDDSLPGWRTFKLYPDGTMETEVCRLQNVDFTVDTESRGY